MLCVKDIQDNRNLYCEQVRQYIRDEIYNFGCASERIAELIMEVLKYKGKITQ